MLHGFTPWVKANTEDQREVVHGAFRRFRGVADALYFSATCAQITLRAGYLGSRIQMLQLELPVQTNLLPLVDATDKRIKYMMM